ncbi:hypothetical protein [Cardinium endosymbiont of Philonthus spinipes]|uniref:hypothetical protein n=1 Tax=Cardinium endosymbiont of Philonthus spinipes TaxID=3077941 RepID=UPI00313E3B26
MSKNLKKYLFISVLYLPALGLAGCSGARQIGFIKQGELSNKSETPQGLQSVNDIKNDTLTPKKSTTDAVGQIVGGESAVSNNPSIANISVDIAGYLGEVVGGVLGGAVGGGVGAMGGGVCAVGSSGSIVKSIEDGSSKGAYYGSAILAPIGKHTFSGATRGVILATPYVFNSLGWVVANVCYGITSLASSFYNYWTKVPDVATPDISSYDFGKETEEGLTVITFKVNESSSNQPKGDPDSGIDTDEDDEECGVYYDAEDGGQ